MYKFKEIIEATFFKKLQKYSKGEIFFVGGCVRDYYLDKECKDYDLVVRNISIDDIIIALSIHGSVDIVGKSFGVIKFWPNDVELAEPLDITLPRTEVSTGDGHDDFEVTFDQTLPIEKDLERRDFTINTLLMDSDMKVIDLFDGLSDLQNGIINIVGPDSFREDPLRMIRAIQFACRFNFAFSLHTHESLKENARRITFISKERILEEILKVINKKGDLGRCIEMLSEYGFDHFVFNSKFDTHIKIKSVYDFWAIIGECHVNRAPWTFSGKRLKNFVGVTNDIEKLCDLMQNFLTVEHTRKGFLKLYNFDKNVHGSLFDFSEFQYIIDEGLPTKVTELALDGNDIKELMGLEGKQIGDFQKLLLELVLNKTVSNTKVSIIKHFSFNQN